MHSHPLSPVRETNQSVRNACNQLEGPTHHGTFWRWPFRTVHGCLWSPDCAFASPAWLAVVTIPCQLKRAPPPPEPKLLKGTMFRANLVRSRIKVAASLKRPPPAGRSNRTCPEQVAVVDAEPQCPLPAAVDAVCYDPLAVDRVLAFYQPWSANKPVSREWASSLRTVTSANSGDSDARLAGIRTALMRSAVTAARTASAWSKSFSATASATARSRPADRDGAGPAESSTVNVAVPVALVKAVS